MERLEIASEWSAYDELRSELNEILNSEPEPKREVRLFAAACCRDIWAQVEGPVFRRSVETAERFADRLADLDELCDAYDAAYSTLVRRAREEEQHWSGNPAGVAATWAAAHYYHQWPFEVTDWTAQASDPVRTLVRRSGLPKEWWPRLRRELRGELAERAEMDSLAEERAKATAQRRAELKAQYGQHAYEEALAEFTRQELGRVVRRLDWQAVRRGAAEAEREYQHKLLRDVFGDRGRPVAFDPAWVTLLAWSGAQQAYQDRDFSLLPALADLLEDGGCYSVDILKHLRGPGPHVRGCWVVDLVLGRRVVAGGHLLPVPKSGAE
jgi:hypothetical protein